MYYVSKLGWATWQIFMGRECAFNKTNLGNLAALKRRSSGGENLAFLPAMKTKKEDEILLGYSRFDFLQSFRWERKTFLKKVFKLLNFKLLNF